MNWKDWLKAYVFYRLGQNSRPETDYGKAPKGLGRGCVIPCVVVGLILGTLIYWFFR